MTPDYELTSDTREMTSRLARSLASGNDAAMEDRDRDELIRLGKRPVLKVSILSHHLEYVRVTNFSAILDSCPYWASAAPY